MKFFVTGGAGFIGSHLIESLLNNSNSVICIDNFDPYYDPAIKYRNIKNIENHPGFQLIKGDILDWKLLTNLFKDNHFDVVVHLAARAGVRPSLENPRLYQKVNIEGTINLLELSCKHEVEKFIFASSSSVYGNNKKVPFSEDDSVDYPISPYAATKKAGELIAHTFSSLYDLPVSCLRFFTVYGPRQRPDMAIHKFTRLIDKERKIPVFGDGTSRRDYTYIDDIIKGILLSIEKCKGFNIFNLGESQTIELDSLIKLIERGLNKSAQIKRLPEQPGDMKETFADITKAKKELGYRPIISIKDGINEFINWYRSVYGLEADQKIF
ncbi:MAG: GDP-mannose 4,6-dehydratase [bacterium]